jgi:tRNA threonylcarbamoyladenosine biosynthesis protein TsaB
VIVLGLDTATPATVVGLRLADGHTLQARDDPDARQRPGHATRLLPLANDLLVEAHIDWPGVERIAVGVGPGTFTGLRIGIATARGLAQSLGVDLVGVSSLRALAHGALAHGSLVQGTLVHDTDDHAQRVLAAIDARRSEVFVAAYEGGQELIAPQAVSPDGLAELLESAAIDMQAEQWQALGDGAILYREAFERAGAQVAEDRCELHRIQAQAICELGEQASASREPVLPDYRRRPDAEIALEGAQA